MIDQEKRREYTFDSIESYGVNLSSRYNKISELATLLKLVDYMPPALRCYIKDIFVDSKACACYDVIVDDSCCQDKVSAIAGFLSQTLILVSSGYNSIHVRNATSETLLDAYW